MSQINLFTEEQTAEIYQLQAKWRSICLSTERIERDRAKEALQEIYSVLGKKAPEIIFCDSPLAALEQLEPGISQVPTPQVVKNHLQNEELFSSPDSSDLGNFARLWLDTGWHILKTGKKQQRAESQIILNTMNQLSKQANKSLIKHISKTLTQDLITREGVEQSFLGTAPFFIDLSRQETSSENSDLFKDSPAKLSQVWQELFSKRASFIEKKLAWVPGKKLRFKNWIKEFLRKAITAQIVGIKTPKFQQIFLNSLSSFP